MGKMTRAYSYDNLINQDLNFVNIGVTSLGLSTEFIIIFKICYMAEETIFFTLNLHQGTKLFCSWIFFLYVNEKPKYLRDTFHAIRVVCALKSLLCLIVGSLSTPIEKCQQNVLIKFSMRLLTFIRVFQWE